jgi:hypothetical protein
LSNVLAISDLHCPFEHPDALAFLKAVRQHYKTDTTICLGDEGDLHAMSVHDHDPELHSAGDEHEAMLEHLRPFYAAFPRVRVCHSNHTARPFRRAAKFGIPSVYLRTYADFMEAPKGWSWHETVEVDGVIYLHGEGYSGWLGALQCAQAYMQPCVIGHIHTAAGILFNANAKFLLWGMNAGWLGDRKRRAFAYAKNHKHKPILSCGVVRSARPLLATMGLTKTGGWDGNL